VYEKLTNFIKYFYLLAKIEHLTSYGAAVAHFGPNPPVTFYFYTYINLTLFFDLLKEILLKNVDEKYGGKRGFN